MYHTVNNKMSLYIQRDCAICIIVSVVIDIGSRGFSYAASSIYR